MTLLFTGSRIQRQYYLLLGADLGVYILEFGCGNRHERTKYLVAIVKVLSLGIVRDPL
jgi:hypothetical protein